MRLTTERLFSPLDYLYFDSSSKEIASLDGILLIMSKEEEKHYLVYWAHLESHTHAKKEGYIGITKDLKERKRQNKKKKKKSVLRDAIKK